MIYFRRTEEQVRKRLADWLSGRSLNTNEEVAKEVAECLYAGVKPDGFGSGFTNQLVEEFVTLQQTYLVLVTSGSSRTVYTYLHTKYNDELTLPFQAVRELVNFHTIQFMPTIIPYGATIRAITMYSRTFDATQFQATFGSLSSRDIIIDYIEHLGKLPYNLCCADLLSRRSVVEVSYASACFANSAILGTVRGGVARKDIQYGKAQPRTAPD